MKFSKKINTDCDQFMKFGAYTNATWSLLPIATDVNKMRKIETLIDPTECFVQNNNNIVRGKDFHQNGYLFKFLQSFGIKPESGKY